MAFAIQMIRFQSKKAYVFFGLSLLISIYSIFINQLLVSGLILQIPHLFKTASPLHYLLGPLSYFFILYLLNPNRKFRKIDAIHLLPFIIHEIELIPFFVLDSKTKLELLHGFMENKISYIDSLNGFISVRNHFIIKYCFSLIYFVYIFILLKPFLFLKKESSFYKKNKLLIVWLLLDNCVKISCYILLLFINVYYDSLNSNIVKNSGFIIFSIDTICNILFLIFNPKLLTGLNFKGTFNEIEADLENPYHIDLVQKSEMIIQYIEDNLLFTNPDFHLDDLCKKLNLSKTDLNYCFTIILKIKFSDLRMQMRINYAKKCLLNGDLNSLSMDGIALKSGFTSRSGFFASFKKLTGETPLIFVKNNNNPNNK